MRTNLIMHFHCSVCGEILNICYKEDAHKIIQNRKDFDAEPTGAMCMYHETISVEPCKMCINKFTEPAKKLIDAIDELKKQT